MKSLFRFIKRIHYRLCKAGREFWLCNILKECGHTLRVYGRVYIDHPQNISFANYVALNEGVKLMGRGGITCGEHVVLSPGVVVTSDSLEYRNFEMPRPHQSAPVVLEDGVWVCANATVLPGVTVGKNSVVAAGSVVTENVPANVVVAGVPAKIKKTLS